MLMKGPPRTISVRGVPLIVPRPSRWKPAFPSEPSRALTVAFRRMLRPCSSRNTCPSRITSRLIGGSFIGPVSGLSGSSTQLLRPSAVEISTTCGRTISTSGISTRPDSSGMRRTEATASSTVRVSFSLAQSGPPTRTWRMRAEGVQLNSCTSRSPCNSMSRSYRAEAHPPIGPLSQFQSNSTRKTTTRAINASATPAAICSGRPGWRKLV